jgi:hypothetical protein
MSSVEVPHISVICIPSRCQCWWEIILPQMIYQVFKYMNVQGGRVSTPSIQNECFFYSNVLLNQTDLQFRYRFWHSEDRASWYILIIKPTRCTISQIYVWNRTLHVSDSFSVHHQESSIEDTARGICHTGYADCLLASNQHNLCLLLCVQC